MKPVIEQSRNESSHAQISAPRAKRGSLALIFCILLMDIVGLTLLSPVAPYIVRQYSPLALMVTMITIIYAGAQFLAAPLMGKLGDRFGRRPVLLISLVGQAIGYLIFGLAGSLGVLFIARLIGGITGGNMSTATAYIADISRPEERTRNFGLIGFAWGFGLILGPAIGGVLGQISLVAPAFMAAFLSMVNVILGIFLLPESLPRERRVSQSLSLADFNPIVSIAEMARRPGLGLVLLIMGLFNFAYNGIMSTNAVFLIQKFNAQTWQISLLMVLGGSSIALMQFLLVQRMARRFGEKFLATRSLLGLALWALGIFFVPALNFVFPIYMLMSATGSFTYPSLTTLSANRVAHREVGSLMGVTTAIGSLMNIFGPLYAGLVYDRVMVGAPYWMGAGILVLASLLSTRVTKERIA